MKFRIAKILALAAAVTLVPLSSASAHENHWRHGGPIIGIFELGAAIVEGTVAVVAAPFVALASIPQRPYYAPPTDYYTAPPSANYAQPPVSYVQPPAYYAPPPVYYSQPPAYYAPPAVVYAPPRMYYRRTPTYYYGGHRGYYR